MHNSHRSRRRKCAPFPATVEICEPRTLLTPPGLALGEPPAMDGTGNNPDHAEWGSAFSPLLRMAGADYADGLSEPGGADRPSPREISNAIVAADGPKPNSRYLTDILWLWGQFIDHDLDLTEPAHPAEDYSIKVPLGDAFFDPAGTGTATIALTRSLYMFDQSGVRQQMNQITAFLDGSMIYGSDAERAAALRSFEGGRLKTSTGDLLPFNVEGLPNGGGTSPTFFLAGDVRVNENAALSAMHTLWMREHNRLADEIARENRRLGDEEIYQRARSIVRAELQVITYNEFLPALLGRHALSEYAGYKPEVNPGITTEFSTAAYRLGHSFLSSVLHRLDENGDTIAAGNLSLHEAFFNPREIEEHGIDSLLRGLASNLAQELDHQIVDDVRNFLFGPPGAGGFDLASLNIQRGRDHGLSSYNDTREALGLRRLEDFHELSSDPEVNAKFKQVYESVDDIDLWIGGLAEDHLPGSSLGETFTAIVVDQFERLRDGDRFWYQNIFRGRQLRELESTTLAEVIERNTGINNLQENVFFAPSVLIVDLDEHHANSVTVRADDDNLFVINDRNGKIIARRSLEDVERVVLVGSNRKREEITVKFISPDKLPGGIEVDAGEDRRDVLRVFGTDGDDEILVQPNEVSVNGVVTAFTGIERIEIETGRGDDDVDVAEEVEIPVEVDGRHGSRRGHVRLGDLFEELFGREDFLDALFCNRRRR